MQVSTILQNHPFELLAERAMYTDQQFPLQPKNLTTFLVAFPKVESPSTESVIHIINHNHKDNFPKSLAHHFSRNYPLDVQHMD